MRQTVTDSLSGNASPPGSERRPCTTLDRPKAPEAPKVCCRGEAEEAWGRRECLDIKHPNTNTPSGHGSYPLCND